MDAETLHRGAKPGEHALHLRAELTRDELRAALDEVGRRFTPAGLVRTAKVYARRSPGRFAAVSGALVTLVVVIVWASVARKGR